MTELLQCPSAPKLFPNPIDGTRRRETLKPELRCLVGLRYLATTDSQNSIAVM